MTTYIDIDIAQRLVNGRQVELDEALQQLDQVRSRPSRYLCLYRNEYGADSAMATIRAILLALALTMITISHASAQSAAPRAQSRNGAWQLPVAGNVLCSDEHRHIDRDSVRAWDLCVPYGSAIYPLADGVVEYAGCNNAGGYGCWVFIRYAGGYKSIMAHMIEGSITVRTGDTVRQNQQIGRVGWTGLTSFGPHVHLEIHHAGASGGRVMIGDYFDRRLFKDCPLCNVSGAPVVASGVTQRTVATGTGTASGAWWYFLFGVVLTVAVLGLFFSPDGAVAFSLWHGGSAALIVLFLLLRPNMTAGSVQAKEPVGDWKPAYAVTIGSEGEKCTMDPVRTFGGVTQATYSAWRQSQGLGWADVCGGLTEQQRQMIFYSRYWVASGADKLPGKLALTYVDFAFNAGNGAAKAGVAACGHDVKCFNDYREQFYRGASLCRLYCAGWLNRLDRIRSLTEVSNGQAIGLGMGRVSSRNVGATDSAGDPGGVRCVEDGQHHCRRGQDGWAHRDVGGAVVWRLHGDS